VIDQIPTIVATLTESGKQLQFFCPYCKTKHFHGAGGGGGAGHRVSHCWWAKSPYIKTGYNLVLSETA
jgi:hypothetical protein